MRISTRGLHFLQQEEGFRAQLYKDIAGKATIGYGHRPEKGENFTGVTITRAEGEVLLLHDIREAEAAVNDLVMVPLKQCQYDALVSFTFNLGVTQLRQSTLLSLLNKGRCCAVPEQIRRFVFAGRPPVKSKGLVERREREAKLWNGED